MMQLQRTKVKRGLAVFCLLLSVLGLLAEGCSPEWKRKFIRKRKNVTPPQAILVLQPDELAAYPPDIRYREHFAYWKSWHSELLVSLGQSHKRDIRYLQGTVGELRSLLSLLSGPPEEELKKILEELLALEKTWMKSPESRHPATAARTRLARLQREIDRKLHFSKVKRWIPPGKSSSTKP